MRIAFIIPSLGKGGAERVVSNLVNYLARHNHSVAIMVNILQNKSYPIDSKIEIIELDNKKLNNPLSKNVYRLKRIVEYTRIFRPDVIISFLPLPSFRVLFLKKKLGSKIIVSDRNNPKTEFKKPFTFILMKLLYRKADGFVFQTKKQKSYYSKRIQNKSIIIANPLKEVFLDVQKDNKKENTIINVGRLVPQKNQKLLIDAFYLIKDKYPTYKLIIYGEGPLRKALNAQIIDLGLKDRVELCGVVDDIESVMMRSKMFILSSDYEGMPNALLEAMACGLPCISTDCPCGGPGEIITDKQNGILFRVGDKKALVDAMDNLLSNEQLASIISNNAMKIKEKYNPTVIYKEWEDYIRKVMRDKTSN